MIMNKKMTNFNVEMYNEKMTKLDSIIDNLNEIINLFSSWGQEITTDFFRKLMDRPAETFNKYLSYECISEYKFDDYDIKKDDYDSPYYQECYENITSQMIDILKAQNKFCALLPDIKETYNGFLFLINDKVKSDITPIIKTSIAEWYIMRQCAEYENGCSMIVKF